MHVGVFATKPYDREFFDAANRACGHRLQYFEARLEAQTVPLAADIPALCCFVNDALDREVLERLAAGGTRLIALRCAGFNNVDVRAAADLGIAIVRVPSYSPDAIAEFTLGLILTLNRRIHRAWQRVRDGNMALSGLMGFELAGKTAGVVGTGKIGVRVARLLKAFDMDVVAYDPQPDAECEALGVRYVSLVALCTQSDVITLHCPLNKHTHHLIDGAAIGRMKPGVMLINTSRGAVIDTQAVIAALKTGQIGHLGIDVYEQEGDLFFEDLSNEIIQDDVFQRLLTFPNTLITGHQGFFTREAMASIAETTLDNVTRFERGEALRNQVTASLLG